MRLLAGITLLINLAHAGAQNALFIPDTLAGPNYALTMHTDSVQFLPGNFTHTYAFNSNRYLGPTLLLNKGSNVNITVNNQIGDTTTVHWHGLHVPSMWDGGPHTVILPNATWNPQFTVMDDAATYWYHPHMHMETAEQAIKGAAGLIIVRDNVEAALTLPRRYGIDDFPVIVQCQQFDSLNQQMPRGMEDSTLLVNGTINPFLDLPAQVVRLRLLNASGERAFNFGFTNNMPFKMIASDGGLLAAPFQTTRIALAPGERAEILLELNGLTGQSFYLVSYASEIPMGTQGGPTMPMPPWAPPMDSPLNGVDFNIMQINVGAATANPVTTVPTALTTVTPYLETQANTHRTIRFTADSLMVMDGPFYFNDSTFNMMRIDYVIPLNSIEVWKLVNETMVAHPFHLHDMQFYVLDRNTLPPGTAESGRKDVILVPPGDSVRFITKFTDFADTMIPYMFHCHILMHEDDGMMGQFVVSPNAVGIAPVAASHNDALQLYPNPAGNLLHLVLPAMQQQSNIVVYNATGQEVYSAAAMATDVNLQTAQWENGMYTVVVINDGTVLRSRFVIQH